MACDKHLCHDQFVLYFLYLLHLALLIADISQITYDYITMFILSNTKRKYTDYNNNYLIVAWCAVFSDRFPAEPT